MFPIIFFLVFTSFSMEYYEDENSLKALYYANYDEPIEDFPSKIDVTKMFFKDVTSITDGEPYIKAYKLYRRVNKSIEDEIERNIFMLFVFSHFSSCLKFSLPKRPLYDLKCSPPMRFSFCPQHPEKKFSSYSSLYKHARDSHYKTVKGKKIFTCFVRKCKVTREKPSAIAHHLQNAHEAFKICCKYVWRNEDYEEHTNECFRGPLKQRNFRHRQI